MPRSASAAYQERMKGIDATVPVPPATLKDFVDHIDYAVKVAGIDHVGIGTDFDGGGGISGFNDHSEAFNVTVELVKRGYTEQQIVKIWGGNLLRVWREAEKAAKKIRSLRLSVASWQWSVGLRSPTRLGSEQFLLRPHLPIAAA